MADSNSASSSSENGNTISISSRQTNDTATTTPFAHPPGTPPLYTLPPELLLNIIDLLTPSSFINLAFASYPILLTHNLAPALTRSRISYITQRTRLPRMFPLLRLHVPAEITLQIMRYLSPGDMMRFVVANYQDLQRQGIAPALGVGVVRELERIGGIG